MDLLEKIVVFSRTRRCSSNAYVFGLCAPIPFMMIKWLPIKAQDFMVALLGRLFLGDLRQYGLPTPPVGAVTRDIQDGITMGIDNGFVKALKAGRFEIVPEVGHFSERSVHLIDRRTIEPDVVICATGYRPGLEKMVGNVDVLNERGRPRFYAAQHSEDHPGLWFFGMNTSIYGYLYTRKKEAVQLANQIARSLRK